MTRRDRFITFWHRSVMRRKPRRWDPLIYPFAETHDEPLSTDPTLGWVHLHQLPTFWNSIFDAALWLQSLYERALVFYYYHIHLSIPLDKLT